MHDRLEHADFKTRIWLWLGGWYRDIEAPDDPRDAGEQAIPALAKEEAADPALLDDDAIRWLAEEAERAPSFWLELGRHDSAGFFMAWRVGSLNASEALTFFAAYLAGWGARDARGAAQFLDAQARRDDVVSQAILYGTLQADSPDIAANRIVQLMQGGRIERPRVIEAITRSQWLRDVPEEKLAEVIEAVASPNLENSGRIPQLLDFRSHMVPWQVGTLTELAWRCLEAHPTIGSQDNYYFDRVAARLALHDGDRAFRVLARCLDDSRVGNRWKPISSGLRENTFWNTLRSLDRARLLTMILEAVPVGGPNSYSAAYHLPKLIDMRTDATALLEYAARSEEHGLTVCRATVGGNEAFWPIAFCLVELYPRSRVAGELMSRIEQIGQVISGPYSGHFRRCVEEIEIAMKQPGIPPSAMAWLDDVAGRFRKALQEQLRREADELVDRG